METINSVDQWFKQHPGVFYLYLGPDDGIRNRRSINYHIATNYKNLHPGNYRLNVIEAVIEKTIDTSDRRPELKRVLEGIKKGHANGIIFTDYDDLVRNDKDCLLLEGLIQKGKLKYLLGPRKESEWIDYVQEADDWY